MNILPFEEQIVLKEKFRDFLRKNKRGVDKYLEMEYNTTVKKLIDKDSDKLRGRIEFIEELMRMVS